MYLFKNEFSFYAKNVSNSQEELPYLENYLAGLTFHMLRTWQQNDWNEDTEMIVQIACDFWKGIFLMEKNYKNRKLIIGIIIIGAFISSLNQTVMTASLPKIMTEFNITAGVGNGLQQAICCYGRHDTLYRISYGTFFF